MGISGRGDKCINNTCNYDILSNERYIDAFFYTQMERRTLKFLNESSDTVAKLLYIGEEKIANIHKVEEEEVQVSIESSLEESSDDYFATND